MPYAHNGQISQAPIEGGIEISEQQYQEALAGMLDGKEVTIDGGFLVDFPPEPEPTPEDAGPLVPSQVSRAQGKAALIQAGMWQAVLNHVAGIEDATRRALADVALNDTQFWQRSSPFLNDAAVAIGLSNEQLDDIFIAAAAIEL